MPWRGRDWTAGKTVAPAFGEDWNERKAAVQDEVDAVVHDQ